ncbi:hypothetical protein F8B43_1177 [Methylorubrum populi]|uniref:Uncharacterized protein n=1 Tax=Methylorubrum populi TaxID=223967 RepID=A0A833J8Z6_9HYPH|nr:hypothetical protein F8B43_1177 [Methylorubrum populi]
MGEEGYRKPQIRATAASAPMRRIRTMNPTTWRVPSRPSPLVGGASPLPSSSAHRIERRR